MCGNEVLHDPIGSGFRDFVLSRVNYFAGGAVQIAPGAIVGSSRRQNLDRDAPAKLATPVAVPSEKEACCTAFAVDMHMDGFRRDRNNLAEVTVWMYLIVGQVTG
jgi:hypothetical protein